MLVEPRAKSFNIGLSALYLYLISHELNFPPLGVFRGLSGGNPILLCISLCKILPYMPAGFFKIEFLIGFPFFFSFFRPCCSLESLLITTSCTSEGSHRNVFQADKGLRVRDGAFTAGRRKSNTGCQGLNTVGGQPVPGLREYSNLSRRFVSEGEHTNGGRAYIGGALGAFFLPWSLKGKR